MKILVVDSTAVEGVSVGPGSPAYFSRFVIEHLVESDDHEVVITNDPKPEQVKEADVVWSEWCNEIAFGIAQSGLAKKFIIRMRGYDVWMPLEQMVWKNVHTLVYESPFLLELAAEQIPYLSRRVSMHVIPSGIDLDVNVFVSRRRPERPRLALIARTSSDKGYQLAFEYARSRPGIDLHVTTALREANPRLLRYLQHSQPNNVTIHGTVNTAAWLSEINATYILSCSIWETLGYTIAEGMAAGCKPLIHDAPGLGVNWPTEFLWTSFGDLDRLIAGSYEPIKYRTYVDLNLNSVIGTKAFVKLVLE